MNNKEYIVVPAYNEYFRLALKYPRWRRIGGKYRIILVSDGSTDGTEKIAREFCYEVIRLEKNCGKGHAVWTGIRRALQLGAEKVLFIDADLPVPEEQITVAFQLLDKHDVVIGSRYLPESQASRTLIRKAGSKLFNFLVNTVLELNIKDTQCGFKGFLSDSARLLFMYEFVNKRFAFDVELLKRAKEFGMSIFEMPVVWTEEKGSKVSIKTAFELFMAVIRLGLGSKRKIYSVHGDDQPVQGHVVLYKKIN